MKNTITLSVPNPCKEKWEKFSITAHGGFCGSCQKEVVDFTLMTDDEILKYFKDKPQHACGKFKTSQLKAYAFRDYPSVKPGFYILKAGVISLFLMALNYSGYAQEQPKAKTEIVSSTKTNDLKKKEFPIKGIVTASEDGSPLPGVNIYLKNDFSVGTVSDAEGKFDFPRNLKAGEVLTFSFIGMETKEYTIPEQESNDLDIKLNIDLTMDCVVMMGEVAVDVVYTAPGPIQRFWNRIKGVF